MLWLFAVFSLSIDTFQAQTDHSRLVGSREGKLIVNYWSSATDPEVDQLKSLMVDAIETYLNGAVDVVEGDVTWKASIRVIKKDINKIVRDMMVLRKFKEKVPFAGFSDEVDVLLLDVQELDARDVTRYKSSSDIPFEKRFYFLVQSRIQEVILQAGIELGSFVNHGLLALVGVTEEALSTNEIEDWQNFDPNSPLKPIEIDFSLETMSLVNSSDHSVLPSVGNTPESSLESSLLERVIMLLEENSRRIQNLEDRQGNNLSQGLSSTTNIPAINNIPDKFDIRFYNGSYDLSLNAQLYLNEVVGLLFRNPQVRALCSGHAGVLEESEGNLDLSKARAKAVRDYILESGLPPERVVMNFFGEEHAENNGSIDRRVIVTFFAD
ncbi:MAG: OmpA family protein [Flavobacteriales bacterium]|jgi:outer membrane protein OmpA-like peptidoglycan-associated protein